MAMNLLMPTVTVLQTARDPVDTQDVAVLCDDVVLLCRVAPMPDDLTLCGREREKTKTNKQSNIFGILTERVSMVTLYFTALLPYFTHCEITVKFKQTTLFPLPLLVSMSQKKSILPLLHSLPHAHSQILYTLIWTFKRKRVSLLVPARPAMQSSHA